MRFAEFRRDCGETVFRIHFVNMGTRLRLLVAVAVLQSAHALVLSPLRGGVMRGVQTNARAHLSMNEEPAEPPSVKEKGAGVMPDKFLIFDMKTSTGSLGASLTVSVIFCAVVELIKLIDPNPASPSLFAQFF